MLFFFNTNVDILNVTKSFKNVKEQRDGKNADGQPFQ